jgi:hypothetical protein
MGNFSTFFFYDGTLTGIRYLEFLTDILPTYKDDVQLGTRNNVFFQQDKTPVHNTIVVREH